MPIGIKSHFENQIEYVRTAIKRAIAMKTSLKIKPCFLIPVTILFVILAQGCFEGRPDPELAYQVHMLTHEVGKLQGELQASQEFNRFLTFVMIVVGAVVVGAIVVLVTQVNNRKKENIKIQKVHEFERIIEPRYVVVIDHVRNEIKRVPIDELSGPLQSKLLEYKE